MVDTDNISSDLGVELQPPDSLDHDLNRNYKREITDTTMRDD